MLGVRRVLGLWLATVVSMGSIRDAAAQPTLLDQGAAWDQTARSAFYTQDQGSRLIPLAWMQALRHADGVPFLADRLARYGYLVNDVAPQELPVGFTTGDWDGTRYVGMTCAACHTRQITVGDASYRIDGGPALADFQAFLQELDLTVQRVLVSESAFQAFGSRVLGPRTNATNSASLRADVERWFEPYHVLMARALPTPPWGPGRLDAVGMIMDRLTGLDIGTAPDGVIKANIRRAAAPARYPFLWNASRQDQTQWPGFADNGSNLLGLARNLGEVYGVFGIFEPRPWWIWNGMNFRTGNSANYAGLDRLENLIQVLGPPRWPFFLNEPLVSEGRRVFGRAAPGGSCESCHGVRNGVSRLFGKPTWATPITSLSVLGTDSRAHQALAWTADTGRLAGISIPYLSERLKPQDTAFNILKTSVIGAIVEHIDPLATGRSLSFPLLQGAFKPPPSALAAQIQVGSGPSADGATTAVGGYESRVLQGIWATAPYLHNGSVPTLADLLKPAADRPARFRIGSAYDLVNVGLARSQVSGTPELVTTDCEDRTSGNSRCGHEFGTELSAHDKAALLEYLKSL